MKHPETLYFFEFVKKNEPRPQQQVEEWFADLITPGISLYKYLAILLCSDTFLFIFAFIINSSIFFLKRLTLQFIFSNIV